MKWPALSLCLLISSACVDRQSTLDGDPGADLQDAARALDSGPPPIFDMGTRPDGDLPTPGADGAPPIEPDGGFEPCDPTPQLIDPGPIQDLTSGQFGFMGDRMVYVAVDGDGSSRVVDDTGRVILGGEGRLFSIVGGEDGATLVLDRSRDDDRQRLLHLGPDGTQTLVDDLEGPTRVDLWYGPWHAGPRFAAWSQGPDREIWRWEADRGVYPIDDAGAMMDASEDKTLIWRQDEGLLRVRWTNGDAQEIATLQLGGQATMGAHAVYWLGGEGRLHRWSFEDQEDTIPFPDLTQCNHLSSPKGFFVAACVLSDGTWGLVLESGEAAPDGVISLISVTELGAPHIADVTTDGRYIAWAEYGSPEAWCSDFSPGVLRVAPLDFSYTADVAEVGAGCLCCGAYWPPMGLLIASGWLGWNYAHRDGDMPPSPGGVNLGKARLCD